MHIVVEGPESSGKGTVTKFIAEKYNGILYGHPGATPLGKELRKLVKNRQDVIMSRYTEQVLMAADYCEFIEQVLKPNHDKLIISDRCNLISGLIYGLAGGVSIKSLQDIINIPLALDFPKMYLIVLHASVDDLLSRRHHDVVVENGVEKVLPCKFESLGLDFHKKICDGYKGIATIDNQKNFVSKFVDSIISSFTYNIYPIDASLPLEVVLDNVTTAVDEIINFRPEVVRVFDICGKSCSSVSYAGEKVFNSVNKILSEGRKVFLSFELVDKVPNGFFDAVRVGYLQDRFSGLFNIRYFNSVTVFQPTGPSGPYGPQHPH